MASPNGKRVLVAVDGSDQALQAARYAGTFFSPGRAQFVLFHVYTRVPESFWDMEKEPAFHYKIVNIQAWENRQEEVAREFMARAKQELLAAGVDEGCIRVLSVPRKAGVARDIIEETQSGYDALVIGRSGLSQLKDFMLGSIADKLVEKLTHMPTWVVGGKSLPGRLLLSLDASEGAMRAVDHVAEMALGYPSLQVTLFHAIRRLDVFFHGLGDAYAVGYEKEWKEIARKELEEAAKEMESTFDHARRRLLDAGLKDEQIRVRMVREVSSRAYAIVEEADREGMDTIVVGRRGLSRVQEFFMGRVSNKVIQLAKDKTVWVVN